LDNQNLDLMTTEQLAQLLIMDVATVRRKAQAGKIPSIRFGQGYRFDKRQINEWLASHATTGTTKLLVVDDQPEISRTIGNILISDQYEVTSAIDGKSALDLIHQNTYDVIFLDLMLPDISGVQILQDMHQNKISSNVVIITGYPDSDLMSEAMALGPITVLQKPFRAQDILSVVNGKA
jgi:excisionase family DNA binding protein